MSHDTQCSTALPEPASPTLHDLQNAFLAICPPATEHALLKRKRGRPVELSLPHLALGVLLCLVQGWESQLDLWRRLRFEGIGTWPCLHICDQTVYTRLGTHGMAALHTCFTQVCSWLGEQVSPQRGRPLAPFARCVCWLWMSRTLDRMKRWLPALRGLPIGHDGLLPGRIAGLFDVRSQLWRRLDVLQDARADCKIHARAMLAGLQAGALLLFDRGYFAWFDELTTAGFFWISRQSGLTSYPLVHVSTSIDGLFDALVADGSFAPPIVPATPSG
jgi:hypothetical protein